MKRNASNSPYSLYCLHNIFILRWAKSFCLFPFGFCNADKWFNFDKFLFFGFNVDRKMFDLLFLTTTKICINLTLYLKIYFNDFMLLITTLIHKLNLILLANDLFIFVLIQLKFDYYFAIELWLHISTFFS